MHDRHGGHKPRTQLRNNIRSEHDIRVKGLTESDYRVHMREERWENIIDGVARITKLTQNLCGRGSVEY